MTDERSHWHLTGEMRSPTTLTLVDGSIHPELKATYIDPATGYTILQAEPGNKGIEFVNGEFDLWLPKNQTVTLTVRIKHGPTLTATIDPRTTPGTIADVISEWAVQR